MKHISVVLAALVLVLGTHAITRAEPPPGGPKWEYMSLVSYGDAAAVWLGPEADPDAAETKATIKKVEEGMGCVVGPSWKSKSPPTANSLPKLLKELGKSGWELVGTVPELFDPQTTIVWNVLKRPAK